VVALAAAGGFGGGHGGGFGGGHGGGFGGGGFGGSGGYGGRGFGGNVLCAEYLYYEHNEHQLTPIKKS